MTLVAELSRRARAGEPAATVAQLAAEFRVTPDQIRRDVRMLTDAHDEPDGDWLSSVTVIHEGDTLEIVSAGPFQRPIRLTAEELMAIQIGLAGEGDGAVALSAELGSLVDAGTEPPVHVAPGAGETEQQVVHLALDAIDTRRLLALRYAGERDRAGSNRVVEPHDVVYANGRHYVIAWCRAASGWRHFRADRVLDAALERGHFTWRDDRRAPTGPGDVFRVVDEPDEVTVRFAAGIARWLAERHPDARRQPDGSVLVTFRVSEPRWLVRHVLHYGPEAEVMEPPEYRDMLRRATGS